MAELPIFKVGGTLEQFDKHYILLALRALLAATGEGSSFSCVGSSKEVS